MEDTLVSRPIEMEDCEAVAEIVNAFWTDIGRTGHFTGDGVRGRLQTPTLNHATHTRLILTKTGTPIAYAFLWKHSLTSQNARLIWVVHPEYRETYAGTLLLGWAEQQVRNDVGAMNSNAGCVLQAESLSAHDGSQELYHQFGFRVARYFWEMKIELDTEPPKAIFPPHLCIRTFDVDTDSEKLYRSIRSTFAQHWGFQNDVYEIGFSGFIHEIENDPHFDPSLWFVLFEGDEIVGMAICKQTAGAVGNVGYISRFGLIPNRRRQGLGLALLQHAFFVLYQRRCTCVTLDVDAANVTGATRLYHRAGMKIDKQWRIYENEINKG
jgi:ribosomal protein S18 acetylase RimI-like enzyme